MPLNIDWQQILLHLFNFVLLFGILYFLLYKPVKDFMDRRVEYFRKMAEDAEADRKASQDAKEEYEKKLSFAEKEITAEKKKVHQEIEELQKAKKAQAQEEADKILEEARDLMEKERKKMLREAQNEIEEMAVTAIGKLVTDTSTSDAYDQFLCEAKRGE